VGIGVFDGIAHTFELSTLTWYSALRAIARNLFLALAVIQLAWSAIWWTLVQKESGEHVLVLLLRQVFALAVLFTILMQVPIWVPTVISSFEKAGATAGGIDAINPSSVATGGLILALGLLDSLSVWGLVNAVSGPIVLCTCLILVLTYAWMAGVLLVYLVESYVTLGGGFLLLAFSGSRLTAGLAEGYPVQVFKVGVKLFVCYLLLGAAGSLSAQWAQLINAARLWSPGPLFEVAGGALMLALVVTKVPVFAADMLGSHSSFHLRDLFVGDPS
jgi:type IV secretion system protein TrbL